MHSESIFIHETITTMNKETILDQDHSTVWYYPDEKIVHHQFKGPINGETFQTTLNTSAEIFEAYGCQKYLSDDRLNTSVDQADIQWAISEWNPRVFANGWKYWAIVMANKKAVDSSMERVIEEKKFVNKFENFIKNI